MKLRIICQICGKVENFDTKVPIGGKPRWENIKITDIMEDLDSALDYEIWICPVCQPGHHTQEIDDDTGDEYLDYELDLEALIKMLKKQCEFTDDELIKSGG